MIENYIKFWNNLEALYHNFNNSLSEKGLATQGFAYRIANNKKEEFIDKNNTKRFVFIGFNALNKAEENIIQTFLKLPNTAIYWDLDTYFLNDTLHDASYFIRQHQKKWNYFTENEIKGVSSNYLEPKKHKNNWGS
jgi:DNA mismatch repair ATPase MutS